MHKIAHVQRSENNMDWTSGWWKEEEKDKKYGGKRKNKGKKDGGMWKKKVKKMVERERIV